MMYLEYIIVCILAYLLGSINSSIIVSKLVYKKDIRTFGSGNAGATNMLRTFGKKATALVLVGDILKGVLAVLIGSKIAGAEGMLLGGAFAVLGHNWPIYFGFKGGKGVLTSIAVILTIDWRIGLILAVICITIIAITRYVSVGSLIGCVLLPFCFYFIPSYREIKKEYLLAFAIIISVLAIYRHIPNIKKLCIGTESKLGQKAAPPSH